MRSGRVCHGHDITGPRPRTCTRGKAKGENVRDVTAVILDRPRHEELIAEVREAGARIRLIPDGDVAGAISTAYPDSGADILLGIGGTPEGVISAAALKCMGGAIQGKLWPRDDDERKAALDAGYDLDRVLETDDLVSGNNCFLPPPHHDGELLKGRPLRQQGLHHPIARHAVDVGTSADQRPAPPRQDQGVQLDRLRLIVSTSTGRGGAGTTGPKED